jgi:hypothetical protein
MNKITVLVIPLLCLMMPLTVQGATTSLWYSPVQANLTLPPGSEGSVSMTVSIQTDARFGSYYLWFYDRMTESNFPASWMTFSRSTTFLD